jgi:hypothetical protein
VEVASWVLVRQRQEKLGCRKTHPGHGFEDSIDKVIIVLLNASVFHKRALHFRDGELSVVHEAGQKLDEWVLEKQFCVDFSKESDTCASETVNQAVVLISFVLNDGIVYGVVYSVDEVSIAESVSEDASLA